MSGLFPALSPYKTLRGIHLLRSIAQRNAVHLAHVLLKKVAEHIHAYALA